MLEQPIAWIGEKEEGNVGKANIGRVIENLARLLLVKSQHVLSTNWFVGGVLCPSRTPSNHTGKRLSMALLTSPLPSRSSRIHREAALDLLRRTSNGLEKETTLYAHTICAGPGVNVLLKAIHAPLGQANPQPGLKGEKAVLKFVDWKKAAWIKFLNDELELGTAEASRIWIANFWKALDRLFGFGHLVNYPVTAR